jgi:hypothetical protein
MFHTFTYREMLQYRRIGKIGKKPAGGGQSVSM